MEFMREAGHIFHFIGLQVTDDAPFYGEVLQGFLFTAGFLNLVFAEIDDASLKRVSQHVLRHGFRDRQQPDVRYIPARALAGRFDTLVNLREIGLERRQRVGAEAFYILRRKIGMVFIYLLCRQFVNPSSHSASILREAARSGGATRAASARKARGSIPAAASSTAWPTSHRSIPAQAFTSV